jgi:molybdopterin synthase sulfur carrier subunit
MTLAPDGAPDSPASVVLLLFAEARLAAGTGRQTLSAHSVSELLDVARSRYGPRFEAVLECSQIWVNGDPALPGRLLHEGDEVAVLPPVSSGSGR